MGSVVVGVVSTKTTQLLRGFQWPVTLVYRNFVQTFVQEFNTLNITTNNNYTDQKSKILLL